MALGPTIVESRLVQLQIRVAKPLLLIIWPCSEELGDSPVLSINNLLHSGGCPMPQRGNPRRSVWRLPSQNALINRYGLNS